jgi:LPXTG-site transpeptidase (sortase) family protein
MKKIASKNNKTAPKKSDVADKRATKKIKSTLSVNRVMLAAGLSMVALGLIFGGYNFLSTWLAQRGADAYALENNETPQNDVRLVSGEPKHIDIPSVGISLEVIPGEYNAASKSWTLTTDKAQWGVITALPNNKANATFIYAHNRKNVFYTLPKIQEGDEAIITASNGYKFSYKFVGSTITNPEDTSIFNYKGKPVLVLQTCTGAWYQDRQLFVFDFQKVGKSL